MAIIAVINRKGGSGKTTLATHLAVYAASTGAKVLLADIDRQQSTQTWLRRRSSQQLELIASIKGRAYPSSNVVRPAQGYDHEVLDTPAGLRGFDLMRVVMYADAILLPVGVSVFDREATADCYAEIKGLPRVVSGRCKVAAIGMRHDPRTNAEDVLRTWAQSIDLPVIGFLRDTHNYVRCADRGITLFDLPAAKHGTDVQQWQPIFDWVDGFLHAKRHADALERNTSPLTLPRVSAANEAKRQGSPKVQRERESQVAAGEAMPLTEAPTLDASATLDSPATVDAPLTLDLPAPRGAIASRLGRLFDKIAVPRFLNRNP